MACNQSQVHHTGVQGRARGQGAKTLQSSAGNGRLRFLLSLSPSRALGKEPPHISEPDRPQRPFTPYSTPTTPTSKMRPPSLQRGTTCPLPQAALGWNLGHSHSTRRHPLLAPWEQGDLRTRAPEHLLTSRFSPLGALWCTPLPAPAACVHISAAVYPHSSLASAPKPPAHHQTSHQCLL